MAKRQFFRWIGNEGDVIHDRVNREEEDLLFEGRFGHIAYTGDQKKIKALSDNPAFVGSTLKEFKEAGGIDPGKDNAEEETETSADLGESGVPSDGAPSTGGTVQGSDATSR